MSRLISVSEEVYEELEKLKDKNKSFTKVIMELVKEKKGDISDLFGVISLSDREASKIKEDIKKDRIYFFDRKRR